MKPKNLVMIFVGLILIGSTVALSYNYVNAPQPGDVDSPANRPVETPTPDAAAPPGPAVAETDLVEIRMLVDQSVVSQSDRDAELLLEVRTSEDGFTDRTPVSIALILDASGSMSGDKIENARRAAHEFVNQLAEGDEVTIISFNNSTRVHLRNFLINNDRSAAHTAIDQIRSTGGTCVSCGLQTAYSLLTDAHPDLMRRVVLLSDGHANSGVVDANGLQRMASNANELQRVVTATIGLGRSHDESILSAIATGGLADYYFLHNSAYLAQILERELGALERTIISFLTIELTPKEGVVLEESWNTGTRRVGDRIVISLGQLTADETRQFLVPFQLPEGELGEVVQASVRYESVEGVSDELDLVLAMERSSDPDRVASSNNPEVIEASTIQASAADIVTAMDAFESGERDRGLEVLRGNARRVRTIAITTNSEELTQEAEEAEQLLRTMESDAPAGSLQETGNIYFNSARSREAQGGRSRSESYHQVDMYDFAAME